MALVAIGFALVARMLGTVTGGGAALGVLTAYVLMLAAGPPGFLPLVTVFLLTLITTRWGHRRKQRLGVAEHRGGRSASQIAANLGAATLCTLPVLWFPQFRDLLLVGAMAGLAEAAADTASSEMGQALAGGAYMITDFRDVSIGTNGAVSVEGTISGCLAAALVAWVSAWSGVVDSQWPPLIAIAGVAGMFLDSVLGATLENPGKLGNDSVNYVSTVFASSLAIVAAVLIEKFGK